MDRVTRALIHLDDSSGIVGDALQELIDLYAHAFEQAPPANPRTLASRLIAAQFDDPGCIMHTDHGLLHQMSRRRTSAAPSPIRHVRPTLSRMTSNALHRALTLPGDPVLRPLPRQVAFLLEELQAPPRLAAHLRAVHDVAHQLVDWAEQHYPQLDFDRHAVLFGAATHDIGKILHPEELSWPGSTHEVAGHDLLIARGVTEGLARFARNHASWNAPGISTDDLLVSVADKVWKGKRVTDLEQLLIDRLSEAGHQRTWEAFVALDDVLDHIAQDAERRLAFQAGHPVAPGIG
ncbi:HD domain-containing protein [Kitasatospora sp. HPMI-4]|uniref:HD domain-containing protein n=1 Tax=Kitasatospora sp. HPMI-4 TaxID=3448443 RepID=UPI003F19CFAB